MEILIIPALIGLLPAAIAHGKGRSFLFWWFFGAMLFILALPCSIIIKRNQESLAEREGLRKCPYCAEHIQPDAVVCKHCGRELETGHKKYVDCPWHGGRV